MAHLDHLVVGSADLDRGVAWVAERLGTAPVPGGSHEGVGTRNALLGLGPTQYLEVLALDPDQADVARGPLAEEVAGCAEPRLLTLAVATTDLPGDPVAMSRVRPDGVRLEWALSFTPTPLFFIDWRDSPHPTTTLPDGGRITRVAVTTPEPHWFDGVVGVEVDAGPWSVRAWFGDVELA
ncbi:MAG TPA: VOC family protein [Acidimicrobiales bacterium]|nr:VOC family protein [Acidimicrobiales bacterium]